VKNRILVVVGTSLFVASCGGSGNAVRAPDTAITLTPPTPPAPAAKPDAPKRPKNVAVWAHVEQPDVLLDLVGLTSSSASSSSQAFAQEIGPYLEAIDLRQPIDGVLLSTGGRIKDVEPAFRAHFRDSRALIQLMQKEFRLREDGDRIYARSKRGGSGGGDDEKGEDEFACEIARGSDVAVCGTPKGVDAVASWLLPGPTPPTDLSSGARGGSIARLVVFSEPVRELALDTFDGGGRKHRRDHGENPNAGPVGDLAAFLNDCDRLAVELSADPNTKALSLEAFLKLKSTESRIARELATSPNDTKGAAPPSEFTRLAQDTAMSVYLPGGGSLPKWISEMLKHSYEGSTKDAAKRDAAAKAIGDVFAKSSMIGLGVRVDRAKTALAAARASKDIDKGLRVLDDALESQLVFSLSTPAAALETAFRDVQASAPPLSGGPSTFGGGPPPAKYAIRPAPKNANLPKGSFIVEERSLDWMRFTPPPPPTGGKGAAPAVSTTPIKVVYTLFAERDTTTTIGANCLAEDVCVETVKKALIAKTLAAAAASASSAPNVSPSTEPLFQKQGLVAGGYIPSSIEISPMTRMGIRSYMTGAPLPTDALANIERDLAVPRVHIPFAVTLTKEGGSGTGTGGSLIKVEMRGPKDSFRSIFDPHGGAFSSSWVIIPLVMAAFAGS
jgi:hypothetical protein